VEQGQEEEWEREWEEEGSRWVISIENETWVFRAMCVSRCEVRQMNMSDLASLGDGSAVRKSLPC
jgi:hypothetical protein